MGLQFCTNKFSEAARQRRVNNGLQTLSASRPLCPRRLLRKALCRDAIQPQGALKAERIAGVGAVRDYLEMKIRTLLTRRKRRRKTSIGWWRWSNAYVYGVLGLYWDWKIHPLPSATAYA
jgi:hypothetical protein